MYAVKHVHIYHVIRLYVHTWFQMLLWVILSIEYVLVYVFVLSFATLKTVYLLCFLYELYLLCVLYELYLLCFLYELYLLRFLYELYLLRFLYELVLLCFLNELVLRHGYMSTSSLVSPIKYYLLNLGLNILMSEKKQEHVF